MTGAQMRVGRLVLDVAGPAGGGPAAETTLRKALDILSRRLAEHPSPLGSDAARLALGRLEVEMTAPADLVGTAAAERLADALLAALLAKMPNRWGAP